MLRKLILPCAVIIVGTCGTRGYWAPEMLRRDEAGKRERYYLSGDTLSSSSHPSSSSSFFFLYMFFCHPVYRWVPLSSKIVLQFVAAIHQAVEIAIPLNSFDLHISHC